MPNRPRTIEATSKFWKLQMVLAAMLFAVGFMVAAGGVPAGGFMIVLGVAWFIVARLLAWWNHG